MKIDKGIPDPSGKLYDLAKLKEISRGDNQFVQRMVLMFADRIPSSLMQIWEAYNKKDFKTVRDVVHMLKPSIDNMGITIIKENIQNAERLAIDDPASPLLKENLDKIDAVLLTVFEQLKEEIK